MNSHGKGKLDTCVVQSIKLEQLHAIESSITMANWQVSDELDARLRDRLGDGDVSAYVEHVIAEQLAFEDDPATQADIEHQISASEADIEAGRVGDARKTMRRIADNKNINFDR